VKKTPFVAESFGEASHRQLSKQRVIDEVKRLGFTGNLAEQQKALDQALADYMVNKLGTETGSSFAVRKSSTKKRILRLDTTRDDGLVEVLMYRSNALSRHLGEIVKTKAANGAIMD
jgi:ribosomal protein L17